MKQEVAAELGDESRSDALRGGFLNTRHTLPTCALYHTHPQAQLDSYLCVRWNGREEQGDKRIKPNLLRAEREAKEEAPSPAPRPPTLLPKATACTHPPPPPYTPHTTHTGRFPTPPAGCLCPFPARRCYLLACLQPAPSLLPYLALPPTHTLNYVGAPYAIH